jgi:hypothetical protein
MTAATDTLRLDHSFGNLRAVTCRIAALTGGTTWDPGLSAIVWVGITDEAASAAEDIGCTTSGGRITFLVESGTPAVNVIAIGY